MFRFWTGRKNRTVEEAGKNFSGVKKKQKRSRYRVMKTEEKKKIICRKKIMNKCSWKTTGDVKKNRTIRTLTANGAAKTAAWQPQCEIPRAHYFKTAFVRRTNIVLSAGHAVHAVSVAIVCVRRRPRCRRRAVAFVIGGNLSDRSAGAPPTSSPLPNDAFPVSPTFRFPPHFHPSGVPRSSRPRANGGC